MTDTRYFAKAAPVEVTPHRGATMAHVACSACGARDHWRLTSLPEPAILKRHFIVRGWAIKRKPICPQCKSKKEASPMSNVAKIDPKPVQQLPTPDARAQRREAHGLIELSFDIGRGCYREGYSDAQIAKETGAPLGWVVQRREEEFGPLKQPSEISEIREEMATLASRLDAAQARLTAVIAKNGWAA